MELLTIALTVLATLILIFGTIDKLLGIIILLLKRIDEIRKLLQRFKPKRKRKKDARTDQGK